MVLEARARPYAEKLGFAIEEGEYVWTALPPYGTNSESLYEAVAAFTSVVQEFTKKCRAFRLGGCRQIKDLQALY